MFQTGETAGTVTEHPDDAQLQLSHTTGKTAGTVAEQPDDAQLSLLYKTTDQSDGALFELENLLQRPEGLVDVK